MSRFFVRLRAETLASVAERAEQQNENRRPIWKFSWPQESVQLVLYDALRKEEGVYVHEGLGLDLVAEGEDRDDAVARARNLAEGLVNLVIEAILEYLNREGKKN